MNWGSLLWIADLWSEVQYLSEHCLECMGLVILHLGMSTEAQGMCTIIILVFNMNMVCSVNFRV